MAAFENKFGTVAVFVCIVFQLLTWFVSLVKACLLDLRLAFLARLQALICSCSALSYPEAIPLPTQRVFNRATPRSLMGVAADCKIRRTFSAHASVVRMCIFRVCAREDVHTTYIQHTTYIHTYIQAPSTMSRHFKALQCREKKIGGKS